jgi:hypothetical protein
MRATEFLAESNTHQKFTEIFSKFLPLAMEIIGLDHLPKIVFEQSIGDEDQPTFGKYVNDEKTLYVALANRHPNDILRTVAHELTHYRQDTEHQLEPDSGATGSPIENEANAVAGIVMRNFNKRYPEYLRVKPIIAESRISEIFTSSAEVTVVKAKPNLFATRSAVLNNRVVIFMAAQDEPTTWTIDFHEKGPKGVTYKKSGSGKEVEVFNFIIKSVQEFVNRYQPENVSFTSDKSDENRTDLYRRMVARLNRIAPGYQLVSVNDRGSYDYFLISKKTQ